MLLRFINYFYKARNAHAVQPPFAFDFVTKVLYDKSYFKEYGEVENFYSLLKKNKTEIQIEPFGAGSETAIKLSVADRLKKSSISAKHGRLLFRMLRWFHPQHIVELGTSLGMSTSYMAKALGSEDIISTFEGSKILSEISMDNFSQQKISDKINVYTGDINSTLEKYLKHAGKIDFAFVDANHKLLPTMQYFNYLKKNASDNCIMVFDDINWSNEMQEAWKQIKNDEQILLSIETFRFGIIFFKQKITPAKYILRF